MPRLRLNRLLTVILAIMLVVPAYSAQPPKSPKNVILMIGDGMGIGQITLARYSLPQPNSKLNMDSMHYAALVKTNSANSVVTDSAAAGTALATGHKTNNGMISTLPAGSKVESILEAAEKIGKATGLVTTTNMTDATPAVFGSHVSSRASQTDIAPQYLADKINVLMGGGRAMFIPQSIQGSARTDDMDLLDKARKEGYSVVDNRADMISAKGSRLIGLFELGGLTTNAPEPTLAEMAQKAIDVLSSDTDGFFLMVEGGQIDWSCHANDSVGAAKQALDFDAAVGKVLSFARKNQNTLVIVTADHETGGLSILNPDSGQTAVSVGWAANGQHGTNVGHTGNSVALFADGPGSSAFTGMLDNTDVPKKIASLWKIKKFGN